MKIETAFEIGEIVWFSYGMMPARGKIRSIVIEEDGSIKYIVDSIGFEPYNFLTGLYEKEIFRTKKEVLESL